MHTKDKYKLPIEISYRFPTPRISVLDKVKQKRGFFLKIASQISNLPIYTSGKELPNTLMRSTILHINSRISMTLFAYQPPMIELPLDSPSLGYWRDPTLMILRASTKDATHIKNWLKIASLKRSTENPHPYDHTCVYECPSTLRLPKEHSLKLSFKVSTINKQKNRIL